MVARSGALSLAEGWSYHGCSRQACCWGDTTSARVEQDWFFRCWCWWEAISCAARSSKPGRRRARMLARRCGRRKRLVAVERDRDLLMKEMHSRDGSASPHRCELKPPLQVDREGQPIGIKLRTSPSNAVGARAVGSGGARVSCPSPPLFSAPLSLAPPTHP